ncbi:MAG TPA: hypothetical protein VGV37_00945 [Aliidongia sp.]|nr:hypothetical protein [Aliidongia sp.]HEV2673073.1 hypothetical protein [Aliidongia sp.]
MAHFVRATAVLAVLWSAVALGGAVDPSFFEWTGRLVLAVAGAHI